MKRVPVYLLSGGRSSRFGSDKGRARVGGAPLLVRLARALAPVAEDLTVVAERAGKYADLSLRSIADRVAARGPLGGLQAALLDRVERHGEGWILLCACDLLELEAGWVDRLLAHAGDGAPAVAFRGERWEPLLGLYHTRLAPTVRRELAAGGRAMWQLLEAVSSIAVPLPAGRTRLPQANTVDALAAFAEASRP